MENNVTILAPQQQSGALLDMDSSGASDMAIRLAEMTTKLDLVQKFFKQVMVKDLDYGIIPGTDKPTLYKPGAEKLCELYGFAPIVKAKNDTRDFKTGYYLSEITMQIVHRKTGTIIAEGVGEASSYESKYRYRWVYESDVPKSLDKEALVNKIFKNKKTGAEYAKYRIENTDLIDQWNTILKMAKKRSLVDAVLSATRSSSIFSQSEDELEAWLEGEGSDAPKERLEKQRATPKASDERSSFNPPTGNKLSDKQYGKIVGDAKRKNVDESGIKSIVQYVKNKPLNDLTTAEASSVIDFIAKTNEEELQDLLMSAALPGDMA
ncbi:hypothetical protein [Pelosinus baikalensis]|uniref:Uncharacterized protein n=1 Tax=Pelosinus baikalensis TaxID=2892015 RepID=A0ABS8I0G7_9FIRM|nr:hypothetical protein [Pelosinus baikalensis]MCC5468401.1 hypothetical protein [Pelosinus baikalensis]MCC5468536.1 hypothetical protein [Pelosinus baikalensis]